MAYDVTDLAAYVENSRDVLLKNLLFNGRGIRNRMSLQTDVKGTMKLHPLEVTPVFQDGSGCGFNAAGNAKISERSITGAPIKVNMEFCPKDLLNTYAEYLVRVNAKAEEIPFEQYLIDGIIAEINKGIDKMIFLGDTASNDATLQHIDGLVKIAGADAAVVDVAIVSGQSAYQGIKSVYMAMPEDVLERGGEILVSPAIFRAFLQDLVTANLYHYNPEAGEIDSYVLPGSDVVVRKEAGLAGSLNIIGTFAKNLFYGTDAEIDPETLDLWWDKSSGTVRFAAEWISGTQIAFPDELVLGTFAALPA